MAVTSTSKRPGLGDRFAPIFVLISIALAFGVGALWQKVLYLENGGTPSTTTGTANTGNAAAPAGAGKLDDLPGLAKQLGVDVTKFNACTKEKEAADKVQAQYQTGLDSGITGTPGTIVMNKKGEAWLVSGAVPYESLKAVIDDALGKGAGTAQGKLSADKVAKLASVTNADHLQGSLNAQVYMIEYSDFQCPFCTRFHPTAKQAFDEYDGQVAWVYRHFPLDAIHPKARPAAIASECIAKLGSEDAFWKFTNTVFGS